LQIIKGSQQQIILYVVVIKNPTQNLIYWRKANFNDLTKDKAFFGATTCRNIALVKGKHHRTNKPFLNAAKQEQTSERMRDFFIKTI